MRIGYASALPLTSTPGRGAALVQEVSIAKSGAAQASSPPPVPVATHFLPPGALQQRTPATTQAAMAYKAAKGAVSATQSKADR
ncbi:hypothetical protein ACN2XU_21245 [Primorskyibacter sp. 2E107]|uniref:hypothetical protein n=1 Tax=Primorskyibacter sp. 2E107 TaxID=3403458 RepID=UPI003AF4BA4D